MVVVDFSKVKLPEDYVFPSVLAGKPLDFRLAWFLIMEIGVASIPVSGELYSCTSTPCISVDNSSCRVLQGRNSTPSSSLPAIRGVQEHRDT